MEVRGKLKDLQPATHSKVVTRYEDADIVEAEDSIL